MNEDIYDVTCNTYFATCALTWASTLVGSMTASLPSTRIRLLSFTLGSSGATRPSRTLKYVFRKIVLSQSISNT